MFTSETEVFLNPTLDRLYAIQKADQQVFQEVLKEQATQEKILEKVQQTTLSLPTLLPTIATMLELPNNLCKELDTIANTLIRCI